MSLTHVPVVGTFNYRDADATPAAGEKIHFIAVSAAIVDGETVTLPKKLIATLNNDGEVPDGFTLPTVGDGVYYSVREKFSGGRDDYTIEVLTTDTEIDLATVAPVVPVEGMESYATNAALSAYPTKAGAETISGNWTLTGSLSGTTDVSDTYGPGATLAFSYSPLGWQYEIDIPGTGTITTSKDALSFSVSSTNGVGTQFVSLWPGLPGVLNPFVDFYANDFTARFTGPSLTANRTIALPDRDGTVALDRSAVAAITSSAGSLVADASGGDYFTHDLSENTTLTVTNMQPGGTIGLLVTGAASPYTLTIAGADWGDGVAAFDFSSLGPTDRAFVVITTFGGGIFEVTARKKATGAPP